MTAPCKACGACTCPVRAVCRCCGKCPTCGGTASVDLTQIRAGDGTPLARRLPIPEHRPGDAVGVTLPESWEPQGAVYGARPFTTVPLRLA